MLQVSNSSGSSGRLSNSDGFAVTDAQSSQALLDQPNRTPTALLDAVAQQPANAAAAVRLVAATANVHQDKSLKALAQAATADGLQGKSLKALAQAAAANDNPHAKQPAALQQLRALAAGSASSPSAPLHLNRQAAHQLEEVASVALTDWESPAAETASTGMGHSVAGARLEASKQGSSHASAVNRGSPVPGWGGMSPQKPVNLNIKVFGGGQDITNKDDSHSSRSPSHNLIDRTAPATNGGSGPWQQSNSNAVHRHTSVVSAGPAQLSRDRADAGVAIKSDSATGVLTQAAASVGLEQRSFSASAAASQQGSTGFTASAALYNMHQSGASGHAVSHGPAGLYGMHSSGADELAAAAAGAAGSPWDPKQGPKLLESLSDFSSFNSSLTMLQQLAGKLSLLQ